jgi:Flp pilus assembly pilin Flp
MIKMFEMLKKLAVEDEGADATEYAQLAALIAVVMIVAARALGLSISNVFGEINTELEAG